MPTTPWNSEFQDSELNIKTQRHAQCECAFFYEWINTPVTRRNRLRHFQRLCCDIQKPLEAEGFLRVT
jgi:hypothetical protein